MYVVQRNTFRIVFGYR